MTNRVPPIPVRAGARAGRVPVHRDDKADLRQGAPKVSEGLRPPLLDAKPLARFKLEARFRREPRSPARANSFPVRRHARSALSRSAEARNRSRIGGRGHTLPGGDLRLAPGQAFAPTGWRWRLC